MAATMKDIARKTGLGLATISKYLNGGTVLEKNRIAIEQAVAELHFTVNEYARGLKTSRTRTIGVAVPDLSDGYAASILVSLEAAFRRQSYSVMVCGCGKQEEQEAEAVRLLVGKRVDGIVSLPLSRSGLHLEPAVVKNLPVVLLDRSVSDVEADLITADHAGGVEKAMEHLLGKGHRRIGILVGPEDIPTSRQRLLGYYKSFIQVGATCNNQWIYHGDGTVAGGYGTGKTMLEQHPELTAILVADGTMMLGALPAALEMRGKIPDQLSVVGCDCAGLAQVFQPRLTFLAQPAEEMGERAAQLMLDRLEGRTDGDPVTVTLETRLIEGKSVLGRF